MNTYFSLVYAMSMTSLITMFSLMSLSPSTLDKAGLVVGMGSAAAASLDLLRPAATAASARLGEMDGFDDSLDDSLDD